MSDQHLTHPTADFSTLAAFEAWCRVQDGGVPSAEHDLQRDSEMLGRAVFWVGPWVLVVAPIVTWGGIGWLAMWVLK